MMKRTLASCIREILVNNGVEVRRPVVGCCDAPASVLDYLDASADIDAWWVMYELSSARVIHLTGDQTQEDIAALIQRAIDFWKQQD